MKELKRTHMRKKFIFFTVIFICLLINIGLSSASDNLKDDINKTSGLVITPMDADDNNNVLTSTKSIPGVKTQLLDKNGKDMGTPTIGLNNRIIYTGLSWGEKYTLKILSIPKGYFIINHSYKQDPTSYEVEVTDKGWVLVDKLNGNDTLPNDTFPGINDKGGKTPFKLYLGTIPKSEKSVSNKNDAKPENHEKLTAAAGDTLTYTINTTINNAANYGYVFSPFVNLKIKYTSYIIEDELDKRLTYVDLKAQLKTGENADYTSIPSDNYTVSYDTSSNKVVFSLTEKGFKSLYKEYDVFNPGKTDNSYLKITIRAKINENSAGIISNTSTTYINKVNKNSNTVTVTVPWTKVNVKKIWTKEAPNDAEIHINLLQNGKVIDSVTLDGKPDSYEPSPWKCSFDSLPAFDKDGKKYTYEVKEIMPPNLKGKYKTTVEKLNPKDDTASKDFDEINFIIKNEETPPEVPPSITPPSEEHSNPPAPPHNDNGGSKIPNTGDLYNHIYYIFILTSIIIYACIHVRKKLNRI